MSKFNFIESHLSGLFIIEPTVFTDNRGCFLESYNEKEFIENNLSVKFVQDNHSYSKNGVLRGLHYQSIHTQGKLIKVFKGEVFDVAVDLRKDSETFGQWYGAILSEDNKIMMYIPEGFAHGFLVLSKEAHFFYKCTDYYYADEQECIKWNDEDIGISWPLNRVGKVILSKNDNKGKRLRNLIL